jgi:hypothetical protein
LSQYDRLVAGLLATPSGGRFPLMMAAATFTALKKYFGKSDWLITVQGINVADAASGAGGDITITRDGGVLMVIEVTERPIDQARVTAIFNTKIVQGGIEDYLFLGRGDVAATAIAQANQYFAQGHEVNFLDLRSWIHANLATIGKHGRAIFSNCLLEMLARRGVPQSLKAAWNKQVSALTEA